jgi:hypothetical protein
MRLVTLIEIEAQTGEIRRYQNYCSEPYYFRNNQYNPLNFSGLPLPPQQLDYSNSDVDVTLGNSTERIDALRPVREWLKRTGDLAEARVTVHHLWPDDPTAPPIQSVYQILDISVGGSVELNWRSPVEAIGAVFPSVQLTPQNAPGLPRYQTQHGF